MTSVRRTLRLFKRAAAGSLADDTLSKGAALAFYTVFSIGPVLVIATMIAAQVLGAEEARGHFLKWGDRYFGLAGSRAVFDMIAGARGLRPGVTASVVGAITLFFGATGVFSQFRRALNAIWKVKPKPTPAVKRLLLERLAALAAACGIGIVIFLGILMSAAFTSLSGHLGKWLPLPVGLFANVVLSLAILTPLVAFLFKFLPDAPVPWRSAWIGAGVTAVLFQAGALGVGLYLNLSGLGSAYGPAGAVLAVLVWAYYTSQTVLYGAEFTKAHATAEQCSSGGAPDTATI